MCIYVISFQIMTAHFQVILMNPTDLNQSKMFWVDKKLGSSNGLLGSVR